MIIQNTFSGYVPKDAPIVDTTQKIVGFIKKGVYYPA